MLNEQIEYSKAIISWLNTLRIEEKSITSLDQLKDGIIFGKLLNRV